MSAAQLTAQTRADIYSAWCQGLPPLQVAKALRLVPMTVISEYVRLDDLDHHSASLENSNGKCSGSDD
jgi:hypothetical protein